MYPTTHDPDSLEDYGRNWGDSADGEKGWLRDGENIIISEWEITADQEDVPTLVISGQGTGISIDRTMTSVFLSGGTNGVTYKLTNTVTTYEDNLGNRVCTRTGLLTCCER